MSDFSNDDETLDIQREVEEALLEQQIEASLEARIAELDREELSRITQNEKGLQMTTATKGINAWDVLKKGVPDGQLGNQAETHIRVKGWNERLSTKRYQLKHPKTNEPVFHRGEAVEGLSEYEYAKIGAWTKQKVARAGVPVEIAPHEHEIFNEMCDKDRWIGYVNDKFIERSGFKATTLLDDATSGGQALVPEYYDRMVITFPLLHSEIFPHIDIQTIPRSSTVETASIGNPTVTWNSAEGSTLTKLTTDDIVAAITASIFRVAVTFEVGNDLMSDSVVNVGRILVTNTGERFSQQMDEIVASGDGTNQPQGIDVASGTTDVTPENPTSGAVTVNDLLDLMFGVGKQYRTPSFNPRYVMTDTRYKSHRALATGVTGDARLLHGMSVQNYSLLESPVSIEQTGLTNADGIFGALRKYRMWRREGFNVKVTAEGDALVRRNTSLFYIDGRFGGRVVDANAFAIVDSWPTT